MLTLAGSTTGHLHIAAQDGDPAFDVDLAGTWTITGSTVEFAQSADTFIRDMEFTFDDDTLVGDETFSGDRIQVTLTRN